MVLSDYGSVWQEISVFCVPIIDGSLVEWYRQGTPEVPGYKPFPMELCLKKYLCTWWLQNTSFLPHYLSQSDCLTADRQGQGDTRLTLTPSVIPNSNYVIMVSDWNCLKYFTCFLYCIHQVHRDFWSPCIKHRPPRLTVRRLTAWTMTRPLCYVVLEMYWGDQILTRVFCVRMVRRL
jgi:hypothetical protein